VRTGSPVVPVAIVGAEEAYPVVARLYRAGRVVGVPWIPVTPSFPLCGVAGALPLPTKWSMHFCDPIAPPREDGRAEEERIAALTAQIRSSIAAALAALLAKRAGIFL
jgi:1-acyl-sn-glycerol-3-phosphate acyltransferase